MAITTKREARKSVRQSGWITLDGGFAARPCTVLDLSSAGAKITVDDPEAVPAKVRLALSRDTRTGRPARWSGAAAKPSASNSSGSKRASSAIKPSDANDLPCHFSCGVSVSAAPAQQSRDRMPDKPAKPVPLRPAKAAANPCAEYGPGFVRIEGSSTCIKIGGSFSVGVGVSR